MLTKHILIEIGSNDCRQNHKQIKPNEYQQPIIAGLTTRKRRATSIITGQSFPSLAKIKPCIGKSNR